MLLRDAYKMSKIKNKNIITNVKIVITSGREGEKGLSLERDVLERLVWVPSFLN
jgi:hypothetical protein